MLSPARSRDRIADESEARSPARDVYPVAKETASTESHAHVAQIPEGFLKSLKGRYRRLSLIGGIIVVFVIAVFLWEANH
jgi:hypothetical protein